MSKNRTKSVLFSRIIGALIDYFIIFSLYFTFLFVYLSVSAILKLPMINIAPFLFLGIWFYLLVYIEYKYNYTIGKKISKIRTASSLGEKKPSFIQIVKRRILDPIDIFALGIVSIIILSQSDSKQRFGDKFASTIVVDEATFSKMV